MAPYPIRTLEDILSRKVFGFGPARIAVHGIAGTVENWRMTRSDPSTFQNIVRASPKHVTQLRMPIPSKANALIARKSDFARPFCVEDKEVIGGVYADGCFIHPHQAFGIVSADCATIVIHDGSGEFLIAAHAGRDSVIDREAILTGVPSREHFGVVHTVVSCAKEIGIRVRSLHLGVFGGIRSNFLHNPQHSVHGPFNQAFIKWCRNAEGAVRNSRTGDIDMYCVIQSVAVQLGIPRSNIAFDDIDTGNGEVCGVTPRWASHRHGRPLTRNLALVSR